MKRLEVVLVLVLASCGRGGDQQGLVATRAPTQAAPGDAAGAGDADLFPNLPMDAQAFDAPAAPDAEQFPTCKEIGYPDPKPNGVWFMPCAPPRRTGDQRFTCVRCDLVAGNPAPMPTMAPPPRACLSTADSGDRPTLCVPSCELCPVVLDCEGPFKVPPPPGGCVQIGLDGGS